MSRRMRRLLEAAVGLGAIALGVVWLSGGCGERVAPGSVERQEAAAGPATVAKVESETRPTTETASGAIASARQTAVASRVLARIEQVRVRAGSEVAEDDILVVLDARDLEAQLRETQEALRGARARLALARTERERLEKLVAEGVATRQRLDQAVSTDLVARSEVARLEQALEEGRTTLSYAEIRSPVSGRVVDRLAEPGDTAVPGRPLLRIYDPTVLRVEVPVRESLAVGLRVGQPLQVEIPALDRNFEGAIDEIVPFADPGARTLLVKARVPNDPRLFAGMFARVAIPARERTRLLVPVSAVERIGQLEFATVVEADGHRERRVVTTGSRTKDARVEVLSGLSEGERVVLNIEPADAGDDGT